MCRRGPRRRGLLESLGHRVDDGSPLDPQAAEALDLEDSFLTRWAAGQARSSTSSRRFSAARSRADDVEPLTWALAEIGRERSAGRYLRAVSAHQAVARAIAAWYESGFDLLLTPTMAEPPVRSAPSTTPATIPSTRTGERFRQGAFSAIFNATGQPAISLPLHWTDDGLPVGIQLVAPFGREDLLIGSPPSSSARGRGRTAVHRCSLLDRRSRANAR